MQESVLTKLFLPLSLGIIMFGMGLSLTVQDFRRVLLYPKAVLIGLVNQIIILPLLAFAIAKTFPLSPEHAVGLMILAVCPGGATSNLIAHLARGNVALSITLTAFSSTITLLTIPFLVNFSLDHFLSRSQSIHLSVLETMAQIFTVTLLPVVLGMIVHRRYPKLSHRAEATVRRVSTVLLAVIVLAAILKERHHVVQSFLQVGPASLALNLASLAIGMFSAKLLLDDLKQSISISIESGIQNGTLGIMIAATLLQEPAMAIPPAIYSLVMFLVGFVAIAIFSRMVQRSEQNQPAGA